MCDCHSAYTASGELSSLAEMWPEVCSNWATAWSFV